MAINIGSTEMGSIYLGSTEIGEIYHGSVKVYSSATPVDPLNPLGLPPYTIRFEYAAGQTPSFNDGGTTTQVSSSPNVWDHTLVSSDWTELFNDSTLQTNLISVLGVNSTGVTNMSYMFGYCTSLTSVPLFDTSSATNMSGMFYLCTSLTSVPLFDTSRATTISTMFYMCTSLTSVPLFDTSSATKMSGTFYGCTSLTSVPLFDTSSATNMSYMFRDCTSVSSGSLALYTQASSQTNPPISHADTFTNCGANTPTGAAELMQIPDDWGGSPHDMWLPSTTQINVTGPIRTNIASFMSADEAIGANVVPSGFASNRSNIYVEFYINSELESSVPLSDFDPDYDFGPEFVDPGDLGELKLYIPTTGIQATGQFDIYPI